MADKYEHVNHPKHYNNYSVEVIDMMEAIYGVEATIIFCEMTAFKYRMIVSTNQITLYNKIYKRNVGTLIRLKN